MSGKKKLSREDLVSLLRGRIRESAKIKGWTETFYQELLRVASNFGYMRSEIENEINMVRKEFGDEQKEKKISRQDMFFLLRGHVQHPAETPKVDEPHISNLVKLAELHGYAKDEQIENIRSLLAERISDDKEKEKLVKMNEILLAEWVGKKLQEFSRDFGQFAKNSGFDLKEARDFILSQFPRATNIALKTLKVED